MLLTKSVIFLIILNFLPIKTDIIEYENQNFLSDFDIYIEKDPREVSDERTHRLALKQTIYARNLFYYPNEVLVSLLQEAAQKLFIFTQSLDHSLIRALGARLLNREGLLADKSEKDFTDSLKRVADNIGPATTRDRLVCIALLGDIGALYADTGATTGVYGRTPEQAQMLRDKFKEFSKHFNDGADYFTNEVINKIKNTRGSSAVGPKKSQERKRKEDESRTGIFNYGERADEILGINKADRIAKTTWAVAIIDENRLNILEPWSGHMSGSPAEILHVWDALTGDNPLESYVTVNSIQNRNHLRTEKRAAKAAAASGFLVATGYHSTLECVEATFAYLGQDLRLAGMIQTGQDAGYFLQNDAATTIMCGLFKEVTRHDKVFNFLG